MRQADKPPKVRKRRRTSSPRAPTMLHLGQMIDRAITEKDIPQVTLAKWMGVTPAAITQWLSGDTMPDRSRRAELAKILGIPLDKMLPDMPGVHGLSDLNKDEAMLIQQYRILTPRLRQVVQAQMVGLIEAMNEATQKQD